MDNVLEFQNITKYFPGVKALEDISIEAHSGEVLAFLGENAAKNTQWRLSAHQREVPDQWSGKAF